MEYIRTETADGMASNVRQNLLSFGVDVYLMTNELKPVKTSYVDERSNQQLMRLDENDEVADYGWELPTGDTYPTSTPHTEPIGEPFDAMIISDYDKGFLSEEKIFELVEAFNGPVFIDSKKSKLPKKGCFIKINELENSKLKGIYRNKIVTKGSAGAEYKGKIYPGEAVPCFDVAGAGDTFLDLSDLCLASNFDAKLTLLISSLAASYSTNQFGNVSIFDFNILKKQLNHILK